MQISTKEKYHNYNGEIEIIVKDRNGNIIERKREKNLIKIFAKEMLSHRMPYSKVWNPDGDSGAGAWEDSGIDPNEEFAAKYILLGASFDANGQPLDNADNRFYTVDQVTGSTVPNNVNPGADNLGDLINPIPISSPNRPLKKIESIAFSSSYQPADTPLLQDDVRALNNVLILETTLKLDEYNGFGTSDADFFTITEIALAGGAAIDDVGACECNPSILFLEGVGGSNDVSIITTANGTSTVSIDPSVDSSDVSRIKEGDQILIVGRTDVGTGTDATGTDATEEDYDTLNQVNPYYLVTSKSPGGRDVVLDRTPVDSDGNLLTGDIAIYRSTLRLFSQRILNIPFKKSSDFEILIRWYITFA